jgi:hypothetical protein
MAWVSHKTILPLLALVLSAGCATVPLDTARRNFNAGRLDEADLNLATLPPNSDTILNLMERGMIRHLRHDYTKSTADWLEAVRLEKELETHSASKAATSMLVNDSLLDFRGYPFERTYLHVFLAKNYLAQGLWSDAGVEARSIALRMEKLEGFPDDAFSRYLAAFCLELIGDDSNAAMQYRQVAKLVPGAGLDAKTGRFLPLNALTNGLSAPARIGSELVCFLDFDGEYGTIPDVADIYADGKYLGSSRTLVNILSLESASSERMAARRTAKKIGRLAMKGAIALAASARNDDLGAMLWMMLLATETDDFRHWETLPCKLAVARVPCPETLTEFQVEFRSAYGGVVKRMTIRHPISRKGRTYVSLCRDYP